MSGERKPTRSKRRSAMIIPWVNEVVGIGEEVSSKEVISRLTNANGPVRRIGHNPRKGVYRNLKNLPNASAMNHVLKASDNYEKVLGGKTITWRRIK